MRVTWGCAGVQPIVLYLLALLVLPCSLGWKLRGAVIGTVVLFALNILRIVSLTMLETQDAALANAWHLTYWPMLFIVAAIGLWVAVARRALAARR